MAVKLVPRLPGRQSERIALQLKAIAVLASCYRQKGSWATAARALRLALGLARRQGQQEMLADLLIRAACVLSDNGRFGLAKDMLDEALVIYYDLDSREGLGMVMVERGSALCNLGEYRKAAEALKKSLRLLPKESRRAIRNRLAAKQVLGLIYREQGDLERAENALAEAVAESQEMGDLNRAALLWDHGVIALKRNCHGHAEKRLRESARIFGRLEDPRVAVVSLDLTKVLLLQNEYLGAVALALGSSEYLSAFRGNRVTDAAVSELTQMAAEGKLTVAAIERIQDALVVARYEERRSSRKEPSRSG